jgi:hypothetical protein
MNKKTMIMKRMAMDASATLKKKIRTDWSVLWRAFVIAIFQHLCMKSCKTG